MELITVAPAGCVIGELVLNNDILYDRDRVNCSILKYSKNRINDVPEIALTFSRKMSDYTLLLNYSKIFIYASSLLARKELCSSKQ